MSATEFLFEPTLLVVLRCFQSRDLAQFSLECWEITSLDASSLWTKKIVTSGRQISSMRGINSQKPTFQGNPDKRTIDLEQRADYVPSRYNAFGDDAALDLTRVFLLSLQRFNVSIWAHAEIEDEQKDDRVCDQAYPSTASFTERNGIHA